MKRLPKLTRRKRDGKEFGAWHVLVRNKPINLCTDDRDLAVERRKEALRGVRKWPRKFLPKVGQARDAAGGTADSNLAALGDVAPDLTGGAPSEEPERPTTDAAPAHTPSAASVPVIEPEPLPQPPREDPGAWAADLNAPAADQQPADDAAPPIIRLQDLPWFKGALVTLSKVAVGLQLNAQAWAMKLVGDVEAGHVGPPPKLQQPDNPESMAAFMKAASAPWSEDDPREPGRQSYETTIVMLIPAEITVPAWIKWLEAPIVTGYNTIPIQWQTGRKVKRDADGNEVAPPEPAEATEAPPGERAAA